MRGHRDQVGAARDGRARALLVVVLPVAVGLVFRWLYNAAGQPAYGRKRRRRWSAGC